MSENHYEANPYNYVLNNPINTIDPFGLDTVPANKIVTNNPNVKQFDPAKDEIALRTVSITATRPVHDSNGQIIYDDGKVENFEYTGGASGKYAVFTDRDTKTKTYFPGVDVDPSMVGDGAGVTYPWGTIHLSPKGNGLQDLEHEYGHILDYRNGKLEYIFSTMPRSFLSTIGETIPFFNHHHKNYSTEVRANQLSTQYFGKSSYYRHK
jgi:hypothetical protein